MERPHPCLEHLWSGCFPLGPTGSALHLSRLGMRVVTVAEAQKAAFASPFDPPVLICCGASIAMLFGGSWLAGRRLRVVVIGIEARHPDRTLYWISNGTFALSMLPIAVLAYLGHRPSTSVVEAYLGFSLVSAVGGYVTGYRSQHNRASPYWDETPLIAAARKGNWLSYGIFCPWPSVNTSVSGGWTALTRAAEANHLSIVRALLDHGADVNARQNSALVAAAENGNVQMVRLLLDKGANIERDGGYALRSAAQKGHIEVVQELVRRGVDVDARRRRDPYSKPEFLTPLDFALMNRHEDVALLLIENGGRCTRVGHDETLEFVDLDKSVCASSMKRR